MRDWNVVVTAHEEEYGRAAELLRRFGRVKRTDYHNVLVMRVANLEDFIGQIAALMEQKPELRSMIARVRPVSEGFDFHSAEEFDAKALAVARGWAARLGGKSFHVRLHRRGLKGRLPSQPHEQVLDRALLIALDAAGTPGRITFDDPDAIIDIETVGNRAGMSLWARDDLKRYPFLRID